MQISIELILAGFLFLLTLTLSISFLIIELNRKEIDTQLIKKANTKINQTSKLDPHLSLMESHKIMVNTVKTSFKNKKLNAAKMLKHVAKKLKNEKEFWYFHRMRNKAAHEDDFRVSKDDAAKARKVFQEALKTTSV